MIKILIADSCIVKTGLDKKKEDFLAEYFIFE